jgi:4-azaleucine resistance transporter AzlC
MDDAEQHDDEHDARQAAWRAGMRDAVPYAIAAGVLAISFGVLAREAGFATIAAIVMSAIVFAGSAQFTALSIVAAGGGIGAAVSAAALMNARFLAMGVALTPSLSGRRLQRFAQAQPMIDASWAMALREGGRFDRWYMFGATFLQYLAWVAGTVIGTFGGELIGDAESLGLDAIYPTFFLALLLAELKSGTARGVAVLGALIALALVPFTPPGVPVLAAGVAAFVGLRRRVS